MFGLGPDMCLLHYQAKEQEDFGLYLKMYLYPHPQKQGLEEVCLCFDMYPRPEELEQRPVRVVCRYMR